jgi:hypothetical protein
VAHKTLDKAIDIVTNVVGLISIHLERSNEGATRQLIRVAFVPVNKCRRRELLRVD